MSARAAQKAGLSLIHISDCGYAMRAMSANRRKRPDIIDCVQYSCNNYGRYGNIMCTAHSIEARDLFNAVLTDINRFADMAVNDEKAVRAIEKRLTETDQSKAKALEKEQRKLNKRLAELDRLFSSLYEDTVSYTHLDVYKRQPERRKAMQKLQTVNAETLLYEPLEKPSFVVDSLIPTGLSLFCGSQKIGKSWLMLKLCLCVSQGLPLWDMPTMEGDVLYLCLEDTFCRIQDRLFRLTNEASRRLHFAVASCKLSDGLIVQLEDYLKDYPNSRLIVIDTLQKVRTASKDNAYASDYGDISLIKDFADRHSLAVIVVHHIRKQNDSDVFNKVSGTTGLTGSADATFVLEKEKRASDTAKLYVTGRDTPYQEYTLRFRDCSWELVERKTCLLYTSRCV